MDFTGTYNAMLVEVPAPDWPPTAPRERLAGARAARATLSHNAHEDTEESQSWRGGIL